MSEPNPQPVPDNEEEQLNKAIEELRGVLHDKEASETEETAEGAAPAGR